MDKYYNGTVNELKRVILGVKCTAYSVISVAILAQVRVQRVIQEESVIQDTHKLCCLQKVVIQDRLIQRVVIQDTHKLQ